MMRQFHELRRHEEGQALVLAAVSMLVLTLCVLATVNLSYAATQKIRLQNAADSATYTAAAYQARALNFLAYTNRAMVVQYASQMNLMAILSYMMFALAVYTVLSYIPYIGVVFRILAQIMKVLVKIVDVVFAIASPLIDGINYGIGLTQFAVSAAMLGKVMSGAGGEVRRYNPNYKVSSALDLVRGLDAARRWTSTVATSLIPNFSAPKGKEEELNRAIMTEVANSARHEWTAYGGKNGQGWTIFGIPRRAHFDIDFGIFSFGIGKKARTEWGSMKGSGGGFFGGLTSITEQIYSIDKFYISLGFLGVKITFSVDAEAWGDRKRGGHHLGPHIDVDCPFIGRICRRILRPVLKPIEKAVGKVMQNAVLSGDGKHHFHFGQTPYARYRPGSGFAWQRPSGAELFKQPPVILIVTVPKSELLARGKPFIGSFGARIGSLNTQSSKLDTQYNSNQNLKSKGPKRGYRNSVDFAPGDKPLPLLEEGFHAMSAAVAYYHRPGDWREPPNLFNPFWGAKLMPITDYPLIGNNPLLGNLFTQNLIAH